MKSDRNRADLGIEFSTVAQLKKAFDEIIFKFENNEVSGSNFGGNYYKYTYSFIRESDNKKLEEVNIEETGLIKEGTKFCDLKTEQKILLDTTETVDPKDKEKIILTIPSALNYG